MNVASALLASLFLSLSGLTGAFIPVSFTTFVRTSSSPPLWASKYEYALLFDCDGVILETEELHRLAYNKAFQEFGLTIDGLRVEWSVRLRTNLQSYRQFVSLVIANDNSLYQFCLSQVEYYDILQNTVGGGKPKMFFHFRNTTKAFPMVGDKKVPETENDQQALIDQVQAFKTDYFKTLLETEGKARPGVLELMDAAFADPSIAVGVCSAATKVC
jgi:phosphoglycolate phosphatase-like HAD superfamily hydrolase